MPDQIQRLVEVLEEVRRPEDQHVHAGESPQPFLLRLKARDRSRPGRNLAAQAAQKYDVTDAAVADGRHDALALTILLSAIEKVAEHAGPALAEAIAIVGWGTAG